jgi:cytochrome c6
MKRLVAILLAVMVIGVFVVACYAGSGDPTGASLFKQHCAVCHPNGDNIVNPAFKLHKKDLESHGITKAPQIVDKMRNPGPGMTKFDKKTISDQDAMKIAKYVLKTFK